MKKRLRLWAIFLLVLLLAGCGAKNAQEPAGQAASAAGETLEAVEAQKAPDTDAVEAMGSQGALNAEALGWQGGSLEPFAPGKCIGGNRFGNYEGLLPEKEGRFYTECDIDTLGADRRGARRIVFSNDGLIYYTEDHYQSFELLYGEE